MKFSEMPYRRPDLAAMQQQYADLTARLSAAASYADARAVFLDEEKLNRHIDTLFNLVSIRNTIDTRDAFYDGEMTFWNEAAPQLQACQNAWSCAMLASPFRKDFAAEYGDLMFVNAELADKAFSPAILDEMAQENQLSTDYGKLIASAQIPFEGSVYTLSQLSPFKSDPDDARRLAAWQAEGRWYKEHQAEFDGIYDKLVHLRDTMGKKLGYGGYTTLGYYRMGRNCYTKADVEKFRAAVRKYLVPLADSIYRAQAKRLGKQYPMSFADNALMFRSGNPKPAGDAAAILAQGRKFYEELSPESGVFFNKMLDDGLMDVLSTPGKAGGGYCTMLGDYEMPFIFANFNGTQGDVEVVTHEAGHAFEALPKPRPHPVLLRLAEHGVLRGTLDVDGVLRVAVGGGLLRRGRAEVPLQPSGGGAGLHPLWHDGRPLPAHRLRKAGNDPGAAPRRLEGAAGRLHAVDAAGRRDPLLRRGRGLAAADAHLPKPVLLH